MIIFGSLENFYNKLINLQHFRDQKMIYFCHLTILYGDLVWSQNWKRIKPLKSNQINEALKGKEL